MLRLTNCGAPVYLGLDDGKCDIGDSKFWGAPDLPENFQWPVDADGYDMDFICQINLCDISDKSSLLPSKGMLYFFGSMVECLGLADEPKFNPGIQIPGYFAVKYVSDSKETLQSGEIVDEDGNIIGFKEIKINVSNSEDVCKNAFHQLMGNVPDDDGDEDVDGYSLLLCLDSFNGSDFTLEFENSGYMYFLIKNEDLKYCNFDNIVCYLL